MREQNSGHREPETASAPDAGVFARGWRAGWDAAMDFVYSGVAAAIGGEVADTAARNDGQTEGGSCVTCNQ